MNAAMTAHTLRPAFFKAPATLTATLLGAWLALHGPAAHAQAAMPAAAPTNSTAAAPSDTGTFAAFGARAGLGELGTDFVARLQRDPRTAPFFEKTNAPELATKLADQFCQVLGGGCAYKGADMKTAHRDLDIRKQDFNALVEVLQQSMDARGIPFTAQNRLLAALAPMHRDSITVR
jgi:hemoglobin